MDNTVELHRRVVDFLRGQGDWTSKRAVCAVSGGPDSVAALRVMLDIAPELGLMVSGACHFEHGIRGDASARDMAFVRELCDTWGVPLYCERADVPALAKGRGMETAAREARRAFYARALDALEAQVCVLGHHQNDQAETVLMQLFRGTRAAKGMRTFDGTLLRPLLYVSREEIMEYLRVRGIRYRTDATNEIPDNPRNLLRLRAIPALLDVYPRGLDAVSRAARYAGEDDAYLSEMAARWLGECMRGDALVYGALPPAPILRRALALYAEHFGVCDVDSVLLDRLLGLARGADGGRLWCRGLRLERCAQGIVACHPAAQVRNFPLNIPGETEHPDTGWRFSARFADCVDGFPPPASAVQYFDADALPQLYIRSRGEGDRIRPFGAPGGKRLKDVLIDKKIPRALRDDIPLLACGKEIWWAVGVTRGAGAPVKDTTKRALRLECMNVPDIRAKSFI